MHTSAALEISSSQNPIRIAARVFIEQGTTIMPSWMKEPLEGGAAISVEV
jgi:hypothetical protein